MASPSITYASPGDGHTPVGSPVPSQIHFNRVASPNHLSQSQYIDSPRSVPASDHVFQYSTPSEQHFDYDHSQELYVNNEHMYDYNSNGGLQVEQQQFVQQQLSPNGETTNLMFMVSLPPAAVSDRSPPCKFNPPLPCTPSSQTNFITMNETQ